MSFMWDLFQQRQIRENRDRFIDTKVSQDRVQDKASRLEKRIDRLIIVNMALWELMKENMGVSEEQLSQKIHDIDIRDGHLDGKIRSSPKECLSCHRKVSNSHVQCIYCGGDSFAGNPIENI